MQKTTFGPLKCCVIANGAIYIYLLQDINLTDCHKLLLRKNPKPPWYQKLLLRKNPKPPWYQKLILRKDPKPPWYQKFTQKQDSTGVIYLGQGGMYVNIEMHMFWGCSHPPPLTQAEGGCQKSVRESLNILIDKNCLIYITGPPS